MPNMEKTAQEEAVKALHEAGYVMLEYLDKICKERGLRYYLAYGTLLGAVREHDFIPWDDDVDVYMPVEDYDKLSADWASLQDGDIVLQCHGSDPRYQIEPIRLRMKGTYFPTRTSLNCGWKEQGAWIDIYPLYPQKSKGLVGKFVFKASLAVNTLTYHRLYGKDTVYRDKSAIKLFAHKAVAAFTHIAPLESWMSLRRKMRDKRASKTGDNPYLVQYSGESYENVCFKAGWFDHADYKPIKDHEYPVPCGWDELLTQVYGDYMTPVVRPSALIIECQELSKEEENETAKL